MKTWEEAEPRERDAWVAEHVMGLDVVLGQMSYSYNAVSSWHEPRIGTQLYDKNSYRDPVFRTGNKRRDAWGESSEDQVRQVEHYTTDASADYLVLQKVREWDEFADMRRGRFNGALFSIWNQRAGNFDVWEPEHYQPGDYSHAAYLALTTTP